MKRTLIAVFAVLLLAMSCAFCAVQPEPNVEIVLPTAEPVIVAHLGGPLFRVFDVDEIDSIDALPSIENIYRSAEACTGIKRDFTVIRIFFVSKLMVRAENGWSDSPYGMRVRTEPWIYLQRNRTLGQIIWTLKHEFVHYLENMDHPDIDDALKACGVYRTAETP